MKYRIRIATMKVGVEHSEALFLEGPPLLSSHLQFTFTVFVLKDVRRLGLLGTFQ